MKQPATIALSNLFEWNADERNSLCKNNIAQEYSIEPFKSDKKDYIRPRYSPQEIVPTLSKGNTSPETCRGRLTILYRLPKPHLFIS